MSYFLSLICIRKYIEGEKKNIYMRGMEVNFSFLGNKQEDSN